MKLIKYEGEKLHELIKNAQKKEKLSKEWEERIAISTYKKYIR